MSAEKGQQGGDFTRRLKELWDDLVGLLVPPAPIPARAPVPIPGKTPRRRL